MDLLSALGKMACLALALVCGPCSTRQVTTSVAEGIRCCQSVFDASMNDELYLTSMHGCKYVCMCFRSLLTNAPALTHLTRAATGICLFYCQNIKADSQRGSSTASRVACQQGAAYFDRFQLSVGVATLLLCYTTAGVTWRLSTDYVLKYIPYIHTDM